MKKKSALLVQFRRRPDMIAAEQTGYRTALQDRVAIRAISVFDDTLPWDTPEILLRDVSAVIMGGSGELDLDGGRVEHDDARRSARAAFMRVQKFISRLFEKDVPTLGICFGHQLIAELHGGSVTHDHRQKKVGSYEVSLTKEGKGDVLFRDMPETFVAQYAHKDSVTSLPKGAEVLADGAACHFSALRYGKNIYTMQFHPELTLEDALHRLKNAPGYLPEGVPAESLCRESKEASRLIPTFVARIIS